MKKLVAYSSVSATSGFVHARHVRAQPARALRGSVLQMINHGLSTGGALPARRHRLRAPAHPHDRGLRRPRQGHARLRDDLHDHHAWRRSGCRRSTASSASSRSWSACSTARRLWAVLAATGIVLGAAYMLWMYQRVFFGEITHEENKTPQGPQPARAVDAHPAHRAVLLDRPLPQAVLPDPGAAVDRVRSGSSRSWTPSYLNRRRRPSVARGAARRARPRSTESACARDLIALLPESGAGGAGHGGPAGRRLASASAGTAAVSAGAVLALAATGVALWFARRRRRPGRALLLRDVRARPLRHLLQGCCSCSPSALVVLLSLDYLEAQRLPARRVPRAGPVRHRRHDDRWPRAPTCAAIYVGLELMALSTYVLAGYFRREVKSHEAAAKYFVLGALSSGDPALRAVADLRRDRDARPRDPRAGARRRRRPDTPALLWASRSLACGFLFKVAAVPFHVWTPDVYEGAPTPITAFMSVGPKAAAFAMFLRVFVGGLAPLDAPWRLAGRARRRRSR